ncbi:MAG: hypothetical protein ACOX7O_08130 [Oscillospiraceae bacterium]|jgi:hypothetical protein
MKTTRKLISILLVACMLTTGAGAYASGPLPQGDYTPMWSNINALGAGLTINSMGKATCSASLELTNQSDTGTLYMYLQRAVDGKWTDVKSWSTSGSLYVSMAQQYYVTSGYYYRVHVVAYIYNSQGTLKEIATQESDTVYY